MNYYNVYAVNGRTGETITKSGTPDKNTALYLAMGICIGVKAFRKNAFTAVYEKNGKLVSTCDHTTSCVPVSKNESGLLEAANHPNH